MPLNRLLLACACLCGALLLAAAPDRSLAQGANIAFGNAKEDTSQPVEVTADNLSVDQNNGTAVFTGNVVIGQGEMRLSAARVQVYYAEDGTRISRLAATGGVTLVSGDDAAEAARADYNIDNGNIVMTGDVLLVQKGTALTSDKMSVNIADGTAQMQGRVKTVLQPNE